MTDETDRQDGGVEHFRCRFPGCRSFRVLGKSYCRDCVLQMLPCGRRWERFVRRLTDL